MAKTIDAKLKTIQDMFSSTQESILGKDGIFIIPDYQRAYNWKSTDQCDKLWQDIVSFIEIGKDSSYFFGSIIINSDNNELLVIDGQQRLTTFLLLLKALLLKINHCLENISKDSDSELLKYALESRRSEIINCLYLIDKDEVPLVLKGDKKLTELKIKYFNKSINEEYIDEVKTILHADDFLIAQKNVKEIKFKRNDNRFTNFFRNFKFFIDQLDPLDSSKVNTFAKTLLNECQVIVVVSYQTEEAIEIFNSLNSTGMPLDDADILSAKLYSNYDDKDEFNARWKEIIKDTNLLDTQRISSIDDILNQYMYISRARNHETNSSLPAVRRYFTDNKDFLNNPKVFLSDLEKIISIWKDEPTTIELNTLKNVLLKHNSNFKLFYVTYLYFNSEESDINKQMFIESLLKLFALLSINEYGYSSSKFKSFLIGLNMDIGNGTKTEKLVEKINKHIKDEFNKESVADYLLDFTPNNSTVYLNEYLFMKEKDRTDLFPSFNCSTIEIEHIMPSSGKNLCSIREDANMTEEEFKYYVNKLGNKILLEKNINSSISNDWFKVKKQTSVTEKRGYNDSTFAIAKSLTLYKKDKWEKDDIDNATLKAANRIANFIFD